MPNRNVIVADIDDCCININERLQHYLSGDHDKFHSEHHLDEPIPQGIVVYRKFLNDPDYRFYFVTGRPERAREYTLAQLQKWIDPGIRSDQLLMRPNEIPTKAMHDSELKPMLMGLVGVKPEEIFIVFDDRQAVVNKWRSLGVVVYQTALGNH